MRNRIAAAKLLEHVAGLELQTALDTVTLAVRDGVLQTRWRREQSIGVRQQAVDLLGAQLKDQRDRLAAGLVGQINVNRAQVSLANEQPALLQARSNVRTAYATLSQVLGVGYPKETTEAPFRVRGALDTRPFSMSHGGVRGPGHGHAPGDSRRASSRSTCSNTNWWSRKPPRVRRSSRSRHTTFTVEPDLLAVQDSFAGYTIGVLGSWTLFDGFATLGRVRGVRAQQAEAAAQLVATRLQVEAEVRTAFDQLKTAESTLGPLAPEYRAGQRDTGAEHAQLRRRAQHHPARRAATAAWT